VAHLAKGDVMQSRLDDNHETSSVLRRRHHGWSGFGVLAAGGVALGMHLAVGATYALTLALAPLWVSGVVALWWLAMLGAGLVLLARRSLFMLAVPLVAIASWAALISAGRAWLGWH
jgi:hypothetical protein